MKKLETYLSEKGYNVFNFDYPSTQQNLETLTNFLLDKIKRDVPPNDKIHFVGYSMGGLLIRSFLSKYRPEKLGCVVQLASPNHGSEFADFFKDNYFYKTFFGPAGQQLITNQDAIQSLFGKIDYDLGIIAGNFSMDPLSFFLIKGKNDGKVSVKSTFLPGMADHIVVKSSHLFFPKNKTVHTQTAYFLEHGCFKHS